jgi:hypothetical protein
LASQLKLRENSRQSRLVVGSTGPNWGSPIDGSTSSRNQASSRPIWHTVYHRSSYQTEREPTHQFSQKASTTFDLTAPIPGLSTGHQPARRDTVGTKAMPTAEVPHSSSSTN